ncbi:MAG: suppressor of fused domain protein [Gemmataceae bacterium]
MNPADSARPTDKMIRLYHFFQNHAGREPEDIWIFDPIETSATPPDYLKLVHVLTWPAPDSNSLTRWQTLGMSERMMPGATFFPEIHLAARGVWDKEQRLAMARFLANLAAYPFQFQKTLDWGHVLHQVGTIPGFTGCRHLLLHAAPDDKGVDQITDETGPIRILQAYPLTAEERQILIEQGEDAFRQHLRTMKIDLLCDRTGEPS